MSEKNKDVPKVEVLGHSFKELIDQVEKNKEDIASKQWIANFVALTNSLRNSTPDYEKVENLLKLQTELYLREIEKETELKIRLMREKGRILKEIEEAKSVVPE